MSESVGLFSWTGQFPQRGVPISCLGRTLVASTFRWGLGVLTLNVQVFISFPVFCTVLLTSAVLSQSLKFKSSIVYLSPSELL